MNPGTIRVDTLSLDDLSARITACAWQLERALSAAGSSIHLSSARYSAYVVSQRCVSHLRTLAGRAAVGSARYAQREAIIQSVAEDATSVVMWNLGRAMPALLGVYGPAIIGGVAVVLTLAAARRLVPGSPYDRFVGTLEQRFPPTLSSPLIVQGTALAVSGADDFFAGLLGIPLAAVHSPLGGQDKVAAGLIGGATLLGAQVLTETPITIHRVATSTAEQPRGYRDLISRIPRADHDQPQIRIEEYESGYVVYLGGTIDPGIAPAAEPWDMTSNVASIAELDSGSYRCATEAMRQAGISASDNVIVVGHSQGGLIAAQIAASGDFQVTDVVTVGAPIHHIDIPEQTQVLAIEHVEDVIPSLSGVAAPAMVAGHLTVTRSLYSGGKPPPAEMLPAHNLSRYVETGTAMDRSGNPDLTQHQQRMATHMRGTATVTTWRGDRVP